MPVYNGNSKAKDLYYGGTKIKEAYYNGNKVYSNRPLYYCYKKDNMEQYIYSTEKITTTGSHQFSYYIMSLKRCYSSSEFNYTYSLNVSYVSGDTIAPDLTGYGGDPWTYFQAGDLYT